MVGNIWDGRASLGQAAGSQDLIAKQLEMRAIASYVQDGMRILDAGCGNGVLARYLLARFNVDIVGIDSSLPMVHAAKVETAAWESKIPHTGTAQFLHGDITDPPTGFDLVITERAVINLPTWEEQKAAINALADAGRRYVMCENSVQGLAEVNYLRSLLGLSEIIPPSHNRYLDDGELSEIGGLSEINDYSGTYYFLSRVLNAALAKERGEDPVYESPLNSLALRLPPLPIRGQGRIWVWER